MGSSLSSQDRKKKKERKNKAFLPKRIYYDADGNLRHDWERPPRNKNSELIKFMQEENAEAESIAEANAEVIIENHADKKEDPGKLRYVVSSPWVNAWMAFSYALKTSPDPGPCNNMALLCRDEEAKCFVPQEGVLMTRRARKGDYRMVTEGMWKQICDLYPGSGPAIKVLFKEDSSHLSDGLYDTSAWEIDQSGYVEEDLKKKKKKIKKEKEKKKEIDTAESEAAQIRTVSSEELRMSDSTYQVDPRTASMLGQNSGTTGGMIYDNPMFKKKKSSLEKTEINPTESSAPKGEKGDDSSWLFN